MKRLLLVLSLLSAPAAAFGPATPGPASPHASDRLLREHLWREITLLPKGERPVVGLVLSAGALRGLAHVGVLHVLEYAGFPIDIVAGTSMGAVVGAFYAAGVPIPRLWEMRNRINLSSGNNLNKVRLLNLVLRDQLLSTKNLEKVIRDEVGDLHFHELKRPFACVAMDLKTGEKIVFREGPLAPAVRASMNLPGIFAPVEWRHRYLVDGGVVDYVPADVARLMGAEWVLASVTEGDYTFFKPDNVLAMLEQVIDIRGHLLAAEQKKLANAVVEPEVGDISFYDVDRAGEAMDKGVTATAARVSALQQEYVLYSLPRVSTRWLKAAPPAAKPARSSR